MESPLKKFLNWFQNLPVLHKRKLAQFSIMSGDISSDDNSFDMQGADKWTAGTINRFKVEIQKIDKRISRVVLRVINRDVVEKLKYGFIYY